MTVAELQFVMSRGIELACRSQKAELSEQIKRVLRKESRTHWFMIHGLMLRQAQILEI